MYITRFTSKIFLAAVVLWLPNVTFGAELKLWCQQPATQWNQSLPVGKPASAQPAVARIEKDTVMVASPEVKAPVAARYAWDFNPDCNLFNGAGLPASPFRTDASMD